MIKKFIIYSKFKEYLSLSFECIFAVFGASLCIVLSIFLGIYQNFQNIIDTCNTFFVTVIGAEIGALALIFTGIVFWGSFFDKKYIKYLKQYAEDEQVVEKLYISFLFLAFNIICHICFMLILLLVINSQKSIVDQYVFYMLEGFYIYWFLFVLGYAVAIMRNCVDLILLREDIVENEKNKSLYDTANELRIDILLEVLYL